MCSIDYRRPLWLAGYLFRKYSNGGETREGKMGLKKYKIRKNVNQNKKKGKGNGRIVGVGV